MDEWKECIFFYIQNNTLEVINLMEDHKTSIKTVNEPNFIECRAFMNVLITNNSFNCFALIVNQLIPKR